MYFIVLLLALAIARKLCCDNAVDLGSELLEIIIAGSAAGNKCWFTPLLTEQPKLFYNLSQNGLQLGTLKPTGPFLIKMLSLYSQF